MRQLPPSTASPSGRSDALSQGKTCIVIAHRLSTVRGADRIAVVDGMHITEQGSRDELMALNGAYARLERAQELT